MYFNSMFVFLKWEMALMECIYPQLDESMKCTLAQPFKHLGHATANRDSSASKHSVSGHASASKHSSSP